MNKALLRVSLVIFTIALVNSAMAQESGFSIEEQETTTETTYQEEEYNYREGGMTLPAKTTVVKPEERKTDSTTPVKVPVKVVSPDNAQKPEVRKENATTTGHNVNSTPEDESVLSFNFLYYMIQKFKFDTVE